MKQMSFEFTPKPTLEQNTLNTKGKFVMVQTLVHFLKILYLDPKVKFEWLIHAYHTFNDDPTFFNKNNFFNLLAGSENL